MQSKALASERRIIQVPVTMQAPVRKVDDSVKLGFVTNHEVSNEEYGLMDTYRKHSGWLIFAENQLSIEDIPVEDAPLETGQKKPSLRLRAVLFRIWEQKTDQSEPFDTHYYPRIMERVIERYKTELE